MLLFLLFFRNTHTLLVEYIPASLSYPEASAKSLFLYYAQNNSLVLFTSSNSQDSLNCLNIFDLTRLVWKEQLLHSSMVPPYITNSAYFILDFRIFVIGGLCKKGPMSDIWMFDLGAFIWQQVLYKGTFAKVYSAGFAQDQAQGLYIFGGFTGFGVNSQLFRFNAMTYEIIEVKYTGDTLALISPLLVYDSSCLYMISGYMLSENTVIYNKDIFIYNISASQWKRVDYNPKITPRTSGGFISNSTLFLFQGLQNHKVIPFISIINLTSFTATEVNSDILTYDFSSCYNGPYFYMFGGFDSSITNQLTQFSVKTLAFSTLVKNFWAPTGRQFPVFICIEEYFYLFGGKNNYGLLNDMWRYNIGEEEWEKLYSIGDIPSQRWKAAFVAEGGHIFLFGGGGVEYYNDLFIYDSSKNEWNKIKVDSSNMPAARMSACAVYYNTNLYIYGGLTYHGYVSELWSFDLKNSAYTQLSSSANTYENNECYIRNSEIHIISTNSSQQALNIFNIETQTWNTELILPFLSAGSSNIYISNKIISIGGLIQDSILKSSLTLFDLSTLTSTTYALPFVSYNSVIVHFRSFIFIFCGSFSYGSTVMQGVVSKVMVKLDISQIVKENVCSKGSYLLNGTCSVCPEGSYANSASLDLCQLCPLGTYSKSRAADSMYQCSPCKIGKWNNSTGQSYCRDCPLNQYCPYGSIYPTLYTQEPDYVSIQPIPFTLNTVEYNNLLSAVIYSSVVVATLTIFCSLVCKRLRDKLHLLDIYTSKHNHTIMVPMYIKKTTLGGICTLLFFLAALNFIIISVLKYYMVNTIENRTLVPLITVSESIAIKSDLYFKIQLSFYGGLCQEKNEHILIYPVLLKGKLTYSLYKSNNTCNIDIGCKNCSVESAASIQINLTEDYSYASQISVNISSGSSIPGSISSIQSFVKSNPSKFFIGVSPTIFHFTLTPTIFIGSETYSGYHVSLEDSIEAGSQSDVIEYFTNSGLMIQIDLQTSSTCLLISRVDATGMLELFSALIGTVFGLMSSVGGVLNITEKHYDSIYNWMQHKHILNYYGARITKLMRIIHIDQHSISRDPTNENFGISIFAKDFNELEQTYLNK